MQRGLHLGFDLRYSAEASPKCQERKMNREGGWSHTHTPGEPGHGACWHPLTFLLLSFSLELGGVSWCHQHHWTKHLPPHPLWSKAALLLISSKNPKFCLWAVFLLVFFLLWTSALEVFFLQLMISAVANSKWGLHPSPQNALRHHFLLVRAQHKSGPSTFKWSGYIV